MRMGSLRIVRAIKIPKLRVRARRFVIIVQHQTVVVYGIVMRADIVSGFLDVDHSTGPLTVDRK